MNKPISVVRKETIDTVAEVINSSGLPMFVVVPILKDLLEQATIAANTEYQQDLTQYKSSKEKDIAKSDDK